tara:strand:- start:460 stop:693 length:234 start_codon:yes stop_codon:yes gene_type:complete
MKIEASVRSKLMESNELDIFWEMSDSCQICDGPVGATLKVDKFNKNLISFCLDCVQLLTTKGLIFYCQDGKDERGVR